ncbi:MAG: GH3 auxin-responsive promoter family protein [Dehalococcoidales bacterium]|nr:GH3 auxin-responsive promoter family protein [Dehalococcoidales bacterium]
MLELEKDTIFQSGDSERIWKKFCGFLDLTVDEFMDVQKGLLEEQFELAGDSPLWKKLLNGQKPKTVEEFREMAPLTDYWTHYAKYIGDKQTDWISFKPAMWIRSSGRGGKLKWVPWTKLGLERYGDFGLGGMILACADKKGDVKIQEGFHVLTLMAPSPYMTGVTGHIEESRFNIHTVPSPEVSDKLEFQARMQLGFKLALRNGMDMVGAATTALIKLAENMAASSRKVKISPSMFLHPPMLFRMIRAFIRSKREKRTLLPRDLWHVKGITSGGADASIYRERLKYYWGKVPHEMYVLTEGGGLALQSWTKENMVLYPYQSFLEFISEEDWMKNQTDPNYVPKTILMNELQAGKVYEVVLTNFYGMPLMRYRPGDLIKVLALEDKNTGIKLPQIIFFSRADGLVDLYSIVRLDERTLWQAIDNMGVKYEDWSARKEYDNDTPVLRVYLELKETAEVKKLESMLHEKLREVCPLYEEAIQEMQTNPVRIVLLEPGSSQRYYENKRSEGADLAHLKPPHTNASDKVINTLLGK